ncbi:hypothetical protein SARC_13081, partial [Sphaeroforma arctica JP610]
KCQRSAANTKEESKDKDNNTKSPSTTAPAVEPEKRLRNLQKKLRQSLELEAKVTAGDLEPHSEQLEKIKNIPMLRAEISDLESSVKK